MPYFYERGCIEKVFYVFKFMNLNEDKIISNTLFSPIQSSQLIELSIDMVKL